MIFQYFFIVKTVIFFYIYSFTFKNFLILLLLIFRKNYIQCLIFCLLPGIYYMESINTFISMQANEMVKWLVVYPTSIHNPPSLPTWQKNQITCKVITKNNERFLLTVVCTIYQKRKNSNFFCCQWEVNTIRNFREVKYLKYSISISLLRL